MGWEEELREGLSGALEGLRPNKIAPDTALQLEYLELRGEGAGRRWRALTQRALAQAETFEIHCWNGEEELLRLALAFGTRRESGWAYGTVVAGAVTPAFSRMVLDQPAPAEEGYTPFFNLFLDGSFQSCHYGTEMYCAPGLLEGSTKR